MPIAKQVNPEENVQENVQEADTVTGDQGTTDEPYNIEWDISHTPLETTLKRFRNKSGSREAIEFDFHKIRDDYLDPCVAWFPVVAPLPMMRLGTIVVILHAILLPMMIHILVNRHIENTGTNEGCLANQHKHGDYPCHSNEWYYTPISHYLLNSNTEDCENFTLPKIGFPVVGIMTGIIICIRFWPVMTERNNSGQRTTIVPANLIAFISGICIASSMFLPGMFHMSRDACVDGVFSFLCANSILHNIGAGGSFGTGMILGWIQSLDMFRQTHSGQQRSVAQVRLAKCAFAYITICLMFAVVGLGFGFLQEVGVLAVDPQTNFHPVVATSEWIMLAFIWFFLLFMYPWMWMEHSRKTKLDVVKNS